MNKEKLNTLKNLLKDTESYKKSFILCTYLFEGKKDKGGHDYISHCTKIRDKYFSSNFSSNYMDYNKYDDYLSIALMHDVLEDTDCTKEDLKELGFSDFLINGIDILSRKNNEQYFDYINRIKDCGDNELVKIKIYDLLHNMNLRRLDRILTEKDIDLYNRYYKAIRILDSEYYFKKYEK